MANLAAYPTRDQFIDASALVILIVKDGEIVERKSDFGAGLWNVWGFLQSFLLGDPNIVGAPEALPSLDRLEAALVGVMENGPSQTNGTSQAGMDWVAIVRLVKLILELIGLLRR